MSGRRRWGLVLGGGGVLGGAWMVGALTALERVHSLDARDAETIVGTSAGSVTAALLGAGVGVEDLYTHQLGLPPANSLLAAVTWDYDRSAGGAHPPRPRLHPGSTALLTRNVARWHRMPPTAVLAGLLPEGRGSLAAVGALVAGLVPHGWAPRPGVRVVALDYDSGHRVVFGDSRYPEVDLADAVMASCAIPGWYAPVTIAGRRYIDGGAWSATSADLLAGYGLEEVFVLAPMVSFAVDRPASLLARAERRWRLQVTRRCLKEVAKVHRSGSEVTVLGPGPEDLEAMGSNLMAAERRHDVLQTSLRTSVAALTDPKPLDQLSARIELDEAG
ncbi:MAG: patatin-like phospholipase family protein [Kineosporiaceae bacterium]